MAGTELLLDGNRGVYIPQNFVEECGSIWTISEWETTTLSRGPSYEDNEGLTVPNDNYWGAWNQVLDRSTYTDKDGNVWQLHQDGDLWAYCPELMSDEDKANFFGQE